MESPESQMLKRVKKDYAKLKWNSSNILTPNMRINFLAYGHPTILQMAAYLGHEDFVDRLIDMGADVNIVTFYWGTALHVAVAERRKLIIKKLIKAGANVNQIGSKNNCTPIYNCLMATIFEHSVVEILIHNGVDLNGVCIKRYTNVDDLTPLEVAIYNKKPNIVAILLNYNADVNRINANNQTPLDFAAGSPSIENIIKRHIVKMKAAGFKIIESNLKAVETKELNCFYEECLHELEWMKTTNIKNTNTPYYDVISKSGMELAMDVHMNATGSINISKSGLHKMFKNYSDILIWRFKRAMFIELNELCKNNIS